MSDDAEFYLGLVILKTVIVKEVLIHLVSGKWAYGIITTLLHMTWIRLTEFPLPENPTPAHLPTRLDNARSPFAS